MILPRLSVAMSVYNNAAYLPHAIESILAQTFADFEFMIVDDGSTDESGAIIDRFASVDSRIRPIHQDNAGLIVSLNRMINRAQAPLIARMDGDDIALPERFARQVMPLLNRKAACRKRAIHCPGHPFIEIFFDHLIEADGSS